MNKKLVGFLALFLSLCFLLSGCKDKKPDSSEDTFVSSGTVISENSNVIDVPDQQLPQNDSNDPENTENPNGIGAEIEAEKLTVKKGKANGIDVSKWQGKIEWGKVKKSGIDFAVIRIGYRAEDGSIYKDPNADYNIQQADKAGVLVGVYFFSTAISTDEATKEAQWTAEAIKSYPISYPVVYDCEGFTNPTSRMYSLSNAQRTDNALAFLSAIQNQGYEAMFYAPKNELQNASKWDTQRIEQGYKIWVAHYSSVTYPQKETPDYSGKFDMWQYTNMGKVNGISGNTDMVVSYFTKQKASPKSSEPPKTALAPKENDTTYTAVNENVTAKEVVNLRKSANINSDILGTLKNGESINRTGIGTNGWSRLKFNGQTVYAISSYLTTDFAYKPPVTSTPEPVSDGFTATNEKVTAKSETNLRTSPSTQNSSVVYTLKNGEAVKRIGINNASGWSKLEFNGQTVYAISSYLTTDFAYKPPVTSTPEPESDGFTATNEKVTAKSETNLRTAPSTDNSEVVYTLKNGEYISRIGINSASGWSKLEYNGQTVYAITSYLTN